MESLSPDEQLLSACATGDRIAVAESLANGANPEACVGFKPVSSDVNSMQSEAHGSPKSLPQAAAHIDRSDDVSASEQPVEQGSCKLAETSDSSPTSPVLNTCITADAAAVKTTIPSAPEKKPSLMRRLRSKKSKRSQQQLKLGTSKRNGSEQSSSITEESSQQSSVKLSDSSGLIEASSDSLSGATDAPAKRGKKATKATKATKTQAQQSWRVARSAAGLACTLVDAEVLKLLLQAGADPRRKDDVDKRNLLHIACSNLVAAGSSAGSEDGVSEAEALIRLLISYGADPLARDRHGVSALSAVESAGMARFLVGLLPFASAPGFCQQWQLTPAASDRQGNQERRHLHLIGAFSRDILY